MFFVPFTFYSGNSAPGELLKQLEFHIYLKSSSENGAVAFEKRSCFIRIIFLE